MFKVLSCRNFRGFTRTSNELCKKHFMSEAFKCTEVWENRLKSPVLQKLQFGNLYSELDKSFTANRRVSVLDVDLFANGIVNDNYQNEFEDILLRLRSNPETSIMYESTSHAAIRWFLSSNTGTLMRILSQRMDFGIYPCVYLSILVIDTFLKANDYISAAKISVLQMLQEDCNHPILRSLTIYSCIKYLNSSQIWETPKVGVEDEDEDVVRVRVKYIRNEYFDDHFDITDTNHLIGKTMLSFGKTLDGPVGSSSQLLGLILYEKFDDASKLLMHIIDSNASVFKDAVDKTKSYLENRPKQVNEGNDEQENSSEKESPESATIEISPSKANVKELLDKLNSKNILDYDLESEIEKIAKKEIEEHEQSYIEKQCQIYKQWEKERMDNIETELLEEKRRKTAAEIEAVKEELEKEEQKLFFFDRENEYQEVIDRNKVEKENIRHYADVKKKSRGDDVYIPPQITRKVM